MYLVSSQILPNAEQNWSSPTPVRTWRRMRWAGVLDTNIHLCRCASSMGIFWVYEYEIIVILIGDRVWCSWRPLSGWEQQWNALSVGSQHCSNDGPHSLKLLFVLPNPLILSEHCSIDGPHSLSYSSLSFFSVLASMSSSLSFGS